MFVINPAGDNLAEVKKLFLIEDSPNATIPQYMLASIQIQALDSITELAALTTQMELLVDMLTTKNQMMALGQATRCAQPVMRTISMGSQVVNVSYPPQNQPAIS